MNVSLRRKTIKSSLLLGAGHVIAFSCSFVRNIILARMLTKADFGIAATFGMIVSLLEFREKWALDRQVIQSKDADNPAFVGTLHVVQFLMSAVSVLLLMVVSPLMAVLFGVPHLASAFRLLAIIPLSKSFFNLDISRMVRELRFGPQVLAEILPQVLITLAAWPMAAWLRDYRALLWLLLARWCMTLVASHLLAERPYRWAFQRSFVDQALSFGWPLLINGFLMFAITQGDRMVVGIGTTMSDLGTYSVAAQVTLIPGLMFASMLSSILLPIMSRIQDDTREFRRKYRMCAQMMALFAASFAVLMSISGDAIVSLAFGEKYAGCGPLIVFIVTAQALRLMRVAPTIAAMAKADTQNTMYANGARLVGLALAAALVLMGGGLVGVAIGGLCGEIVSYTVSAVRFSKRHAVPIADSSAAALMCMACVSLSGVLSFSYADVAKWWIGLPLGIVAALATATASILVLDELRSEACILIKGAWTIGGRASREPRV